MKTHLLHVEQDDNVISIVDKLSWGKAKRVLLLYPTSPGFKLKKMDLLLIKRSAIRQGFLIGIVSRQTYIKLLAEELGIPVFKSIKKAQRKTWLSMDSELKKKGNRKSVEELRSMGLAVKSSQLKWTTHNGVRLFFFSLGVLSVILISIIFIPSAKISLNLPEVNQRVSISVVADERISYVNLTGKIPVNLTEITIEGSRVAAISTKTSVPDKYSVGKVTFTNLTDAKIEIPLGTIVSRQDGIGIRFETIQKGNLPAGVGQSIELDIRALTPGKAGNSEAYSLDSLIGELGTSLSVFNPQPTYGGSDRLTTQANEEDRNLLAGLLEEDLKMQAIEKVQDQLAEGDIIFPDAVEIKDIIEKDFVPAPGQSGDRLFLDLKLVFSIQYAAYPDLARLVEPVLKAGLPQGYAAVPDRLVSFLLLEKPKTGLDGTTTLELQAEQKIRKNVNNLYLVNLVRGKSIQESLEILETELGTGSNPIVEVSPSWWPKLPGVPLRIAIFN